MINIIVFFIIFIIIVYLIFHLFVMFSKSFNMIDENFNNIITNIKDKHINNLFKENENTDKRFNKYLRYDFLLSFILGSLWFLFPILMFNLTLEEKKKFVLKSAYTSKYLGLFMVITGIISLNYLKKPINEKIKILYSKIFAAIIIKITIFMNVHYLKRISFNNIISLFLNSIWLFNSIIAVLDYHNIILPISESDNNINDINDDKNIKK